MFSCLGHAIFVLLTGDSDGEFECSGWTLSVKGRTGWRCCCEVLGTLGVSTSCAQVAQQQDLGTTDLLLD